MRKGLGRHNYRSAGGPVPSLVLDFAGTGVLDPRVTFTRSTTGTYYNSSGVLSTAAINAARFDYNPSTLAPLGLLIEQSSTNLLLQSQNLGTTWLTSGTSSVAINSNTAPDGTSTGNKITANSATNSYILQSFTTSATTYTLSAYLKAGTNNYASLLYQVGANTYAGAVFDLSLGVVGETKSGTTTSTQVISSSITSVGNGWYRCSMTFSTTSVGTYYSFIQFAAAATGNIWSIFGNISVITIGNTIFAWGVQLETFLASTSYITTTTAQVTRAADNASITGANFTSFYNTTQGTLFAEASVNSVANPLNQNIISIYLSATNYIRLWLWQGDPSKIRFTNLNSGVSTELVSPAVSANTYFKVASVYQNSNFLLDLNGGAVVSSSSGSVAQGLTSFNIGNFSGSNEYMTGRIKKIAYYPQAVTSAQLQALTGS